MKKLLTTFAAVVLLAGCSNGGNTTTTETPAATETPVATEAPVASETPVETVAPTASAQAETTEEVALTDGEFTGTAKGFGGDVTVTLTVEGGKITAATVEGASETEGLGLTVVEEAGEQIVANQGHIDTVAGSTVTSEAVNAAIDAALAA